MGEPEVISISKPLSNYNIKKLAVGVPFFRGVFMRDTLPKTPWLNEAGVLNLDSNDGMGTHWVGYRKIKNIVIYFDSFGNLPPPLELIQYFRKADQILYNYNRFQNFNETNCGQISLGFLYMKDPFKLVLKNI